MARRRNELARFAMAAVFAGIGATHFAKPEGFDAVIPAPLPAPRALTYASGAAELVGALALVARPRRQVGWALAALLVAVFPANVNQAVHGTPFPGLPSTPRWLLWARLPLQPVMIWLVLAATRPGGRATAATVNPST